MRQACEYFRSLEKTRVLTALADAAHLHRHLPLKLGILAEGNLPHPATPFFTQKGVFTQSSSLM